MKGTRAARHRTDSDIVPPPAWQCGQAAHSRTQASWRAARRAGLDPEGRSGYTLQPAGSAARGRRRHSRNGDAGATGLPPRAPPEQELSRSRQTTGHRTFRILEAREDSGPSGSPPEGNDHEKLPPRPSSGMCSDAHKERPARPFSSTPNRVGRRRRTREHRSHHGYLTERLTLRGAPPYSTTWLNERCSAGRCLSCSRRRNSSADASRTRNRGANGRPACGAVRDLARGGLEAHQGARKRRADPARGGARRTHLCRLDPGPLASAHQWLTFYERFWTDRLNVLERLLRENDASES